MSTPPIGLNANGVAVSGYRIPNTQKIFLPQYLGASNANVALPKCYDYATSSTCAGYVAQSPYRGDTYGFSIDPSDPQKCMLALGHNNVLWRFDYLNGQIGCGRINTPVPEVELCSTGKKAPMIFNWTQIKVLTPGASGQLFVAQGTNAPVQINLSSGTSIYAVPPSLATGPVGLDFTYVPAGAAPAELDLEIFYAPGWDQEICYQATVNQCGVVSNTATMKGALPAAFSVSQTVDLGKAVGPKCDPVDPPPVTFACLSADPKVTCGTTPGTYVVTLSPNSTGSTSPSEFEVTVLTPGVSIQNAQPKYIIGPSGQLQLTLIGANPSDVIEFDISGSQADPQSKDGMSICCVDKIKITIPKDLECWKPALVVTKECDPPVQGPAGLVAQCRITVSGTNLLPGVPVTVTENLSGSGILTALAAANSAHPWTCDPVSAPSPQKCTIDGGALIAAGGTSVINATVSFSSSADAKASKNCTSGSYKSETQNQGKPLETAQDCDDFGGIEVEKRFVDKSCSPGSACVFEIVIKNTSATKPFNGPVAISEDMGGVNLAIGSIVPPLCTPAPTQTPFACVSNVNLPAGGSQVYTVNASLPMGAIPMGSMQTLKNCVKTANPPGSTSGEWWSTWFETVPSQQACAETTACGFACHMAEDKIANLTVQKVLSSQSCVPGSTCTYTITVTNTGNASVFTPITLTENIPSGSTLVAVNNLPWSCAPTSTPNQLGCAYPPTTLNAGATLSFDIQLAIPANFADPTIKNCVGFETSIEGLIGENARLFGQTVTTGSAEEIAEYLVKRGLAQPSAAKMAAQFERRVGAAATQRTGALSCAETPVGPPPNGPTPTLSIGKTCDPATPKQGPVLGAYEANCRITVTTTGPQVGTITINDQITGVTGVNLTSMTAPAPWACSGTSCNVNGASLNQTTSTSVINAVIAFPTSGHVVETQNCATVAVAGVEQGKSCTPFTAQQAGSLSVKKEVINNADFPITDLQYNVTVTCTGNPTPTMSQSLLDGETKTFQTYTPGTACTVQEDPPGPTNACGGMIPNWSTAVVPPTTLTVFPNGATIIVRNTLNCDCPPGHSKGQGKCTKIVDPTPNCDTKTTKLSGNSCRCVIRGMVPVSKTSCACPDGEQLKNGACSVPPPPPPKCDGETAKLQGNRCVCTSRGMVPVSKTSCACPKGQKIVNGRCVVPPPPPPKCDGETAKLQGNRCVCTVRGMVPVSKTSCACPKGQKIVNGRCTVPPPPPPKCDGVTAVPNGKACVCRFDDMRKRNATSCGCAQRGARFVRGKGCIVERVEPPRERCPRGTISTPLGCVRPDKVIDLLKPDNKPKGDVPRP